MDGKSFWIKFKKQLNYSTMNFINTVKDQLKTYCPKCKTEIFRHAHVCPKCGYDLNSPAYRKRKSIELKFIRYWFLFCTLIFLISVLSNSNAGVVFFLCLLFFGCGVFVIGKISKYTDFFHWRQFAMTVCRHQFWTVFTDFLH